MDEGQFRSLVAQGLSQRAIGLKLGKSQASVKYWLRKYGLVTKTTPGPRSLHGTDRTCSLCGRDYRYSRAAGNGLTVCGSCRVKKNRRRLKQRAVDHLGGKCVKCGYNKSLRALQFHHTDPKMKEATISSWMSLGWPTILKEIEKCVLLCANCHAEEHETLARGVGVNTPL